MTRPTPWDDIGNPVADYTVRLIRGTSAVPLYWGKDASGQCLLIVELLGDHTNQFRADSTSVHGIDVDLRNGDQPQQQRLVLTLEKHVDRDLFLGLCETLIANLAPVSDSAVALSVSLTHMKRWKAFLAGRKTRMLSAEEVRGLFAELSCLRALYQRTLPSLAAVEAWCGPESIHQDFIFGNEAVEVKSLSGKEHSSVRISSEDQLETTVDNLFLLVYRLAASPDSDQALSLNALISLVEGELANSDALEIFSEKLAALGYAPLLEYDAPRFVVSGTQAFRVEEPFPRLLRSRLPSGIARIAYDIQLEAIKSYECDQDQIFGGN